MSDELKPLSVPVRFFVDNPDNQEDGEDTLREVCEADFLEADGVILYERHTVFENGVSQICLTKDAWGRG